MFWVVHPKIAGRNLFLEGAGMASRNTSCSPRQLYPHGLNQTGQNWGGKSSGFGSRPTKKARQVSKKKQTKLAASDSFSLSLSNWVGSFVPFLFLACSCSQLPKAGQIPDAGISTCPVCVLGAPFFIRLTSSILYAMI